MKYIHILAVSMLVSAGTASAASFTTSVEERADVIQTQLKGNNSYKAYLARELADVALEEKSQHDIAIARAFMDKAEVYAAQAGGEK